MGEHQPDPVGLLLFNVLAMVAEFESDLIRARTREGMQVAKAKGRLRGKQPKFTKIVYSWIPFAAKLSR